MFEKFCRRQDPQIDFGEKPYELVDYEGKQESTVNLDQLLAAEDRPASVVSMISLSARSLEYHDEADTIFKGLQDNEIAFIGIWGSQGSEKKQFYDKVLQLCGVEHPQYGAQRLNGSKIKDSRQSEIKDSRCQKFDDYQQSRFNDYQQSRVGGGCSELVFYDRPLVKGNTHIFLLEPSGYKKGQKLSRREKIQLDIMLSICSVLIFMESPDEELDTAFKHFEGALNRLYNNQISSKQTQISWPQALFYLHVGQAKIFKQKEPSQMFASFQYRSLPPNELRGEGVVNSANSSIGRVFQQIYQKVQPKTYKMLKFNGMTMPNILSQMISTLNVHNAMHIPRVFEKARESVCSSIYMTHAILYLNKLKKSINDDQIYDMDYLLEVFENASKATMSSFDQNNRKVMIDENTGIQRNLDDTYSLKLQDYIEEKERNIIAINAQKSTDQLAQKEMSKQPEDGVTVYIQEQKKKLNSYDSNVHTKVVASTLKECCRAASSGNQELREKRKLISLKKKQIEGMNSLRGIDHEINALQQKIQANTGRSSSQCKANELSQLKKSLQQKYAQKQQEEKLNKDMGVQEPGFIMDSSVTVPNLKFVDPQDKHVQRSLLLQASIVKKKGQIAKLQEKLKSTPKPESKIKGKSRKSKKKI